MEPEFADAVAVLERTPSTLRALLLGLPDSWIARHEGDGTFGPREVLGHLIHGEKTDWPPRIRRILESGDSLAFDPFEREGFGDLDTLSIEKLLDEFARLRAANLEFLKGLSLGPKEMTLVGRHPAFGVVTLGQLLATWVVHDLNHVSQTVRVLSARYDAAVGPWKAYLGILNRR